MQNLPGHGPGKLIKVILPEQGDWTRQSSEVLSKLNKIVVLLWWAWHFRVPRLTPLFRVCSSSAFPPGFLPHRCESCAGCLNVPFRWQSCEQRLRGKGTSTELSNSEHACIPLKIPALTNLSQPDADTL